MRPGYFRPSNTHSKGENQCAQASDSFRSRLLLRSAYWPQLVGPTPSRQPPTHPQPPRQQGPQHQAPRRQRRRPPPSQPPAQPPLQAPPTSPPASLSTPVAVATARSPTRPNV